MEGEEGEAAVVKEGRGNGFGVNCACLHRNHLWAEEHTKVTVDVVNEKEIIDLELLGIHCLVSFSESSDLSMLLLQSSPQIVVQ